MWTLVPVWQLAEPAGDGSPHAMRRLLGEAVWNADAGCLDEPQGRRRFAQLVARAAAGSARATRREQ